MTDHILNIVQANADWAVIFVFIIAFAESLAIIGLLIPGWMLLLGIGGMVGADILNFYPIALAAYLGAVTGEYLSFQLGVHYHQQILSWPFVARHQTLIDRSHEFFRKHGIAGVFAGRFFGPTRAIVPFIAGISEMKTSAFFWVNILSGLLWAPFYLIPGILVGAAFALEKEASYYLTLILVLIAVGFSMAFKFNKQYLMAPSEEKNFLPLFKLLLSLLINVILIVAFVHSPYWELLLQILSTLWSKL